MRTLLLMRHAKSRWANASLADEDRPLNKRGKTAANQMGKFLRDKNLAPDLILTSSAKRARQTAKRLKDAGDFDADSTRLDKLYMTGSDAYLGCIEATSKSVKTLLVIGHNPDMESLILLLADRHELMPTAAIAQLRIDSDDWRGVRDSSCCKLVAVHRPKELAGRD